MKKGKNYVMKNEKRVNKSINKIEFDTKSYSLLHILTHSRFHQSILRPQPLSLWPTLLPKKYVQEWPSGQIPVPSQQ